MFEYVYFSILYVLYMYVHALTLPVCGLSFILKSLVIIDIRKQRLWSDYNADAGLIVYSVEYFLICNGP